MLCMLLGKGGALLLIIIYYAEKGKCCTFICHARVDDRHHKYIIMIRYVINEISIYNDNNIRVYNIYYFMMFNNNNINIAYLIML